MSNRESSFCAVLLAAAFLGQMAQSDGVHFGPVSADRPVMSLDQTALIVAGRDRTAVVVRTGLRDAPSGAAWFMPVPARPYDLRAVDDPFPALDRLSAPLSDSTWRRSGAPSGLAGGGMPDGIVVDTRIVLGVMDIAVLSADTPDVLLAWLDREGFRAPDGASTVFGGYVRRGWWWIAVKIVGDGRGADAIPKPLAFTYDAPAIYPMTISSLSASAYTDIALFVVASSRATFVGPRGRPMAEAEIHIDRRHVEGSTSPVLVTQMASPIDQWLDAPFRIGRGGRGSHDVVDRPADRWRTIALLMPLLEAVGLPAPSTAAPDDVPWMTRLRLQLTPAEMRWDLRVIPSVAKTVVTRGTDE